MLTSFDESSEAVIRKVIRRLIPFCIILFLLNYIDRTNIAIAKSNMLAYIPGFTDDVYAIGASLFFIPYCLFELPSNLIQQRVGARRWIARIMITWGIIAACFITITGPWSFYTLRILLGFAEAGFFPGVLLYLSLWVPREHRARASALFFVSQAVALAIGNSLGGIVLSLAASLPGQPWQWLFLIEGIPSIIMGVVVLYYLTDEPAHAKWLTAVERAKLIEVMDFDRRRVIAQSDAASTPTSKEADKTPNSHKGDGHSRQDFVHAFSSPFTWILSLIYGGMVWAYFPVNTYAASIFKGVLINAGVIIPKPAATQVATTLASAAGQTLLAATRPALPTPTPEHIIALYTGLLSSIPFVVAALTMLLIARHSDRTGERKFHIATMCGFMGAGLAIAGVAEHITTGTPMTILVVIGLTLAAIGWFGGFAIFWSVPPQLLTGTAVAASLAIINSIGNLIGNFAAPQAKVWFHLNDNKFVLTCSLFGFAACIGTLFLKLPARPPQNLEAVAARSMPPSTPQVTKNS